MFDTVLTCGHAGQELCFEQRNEADVLLQLQEVSDELETEKTQQPVGTSSSSKDEDRPMTCEVCNKS